MYPAMASYISKILEVIRVLQVSLMRMGMLNFYLLFSMNLGMLLGKNYDKINYRLQIRL